MGISSVSSSNEAYLQKLLAQQQAQSQSSTSVDSADSDDTSAVDSTAQTTSYDVLELSGSSVSSANKALLGSDQGNYDSVNLSNEGQQYLDTQSTAAQSSATDSTDQAETSDDTDSSENLSLYTDEQLKKLLEEGDITQTDYNAEIARREAEEAQKEALAQNDQQSSTAAAIE